MAPSEKTQLEAQIVDLVSREALAPAQLVDKVGAAREDAVRTVVWELLDQGTLAVTEDRKLRKARSAQAGE